MKRIAVAMLVLTAVAWGARKDLNPADYPNTAHVVSIVNRERQTEYDPVTGRRIYGVTNIRRTEIQIGSVIFESDQLCDQAHVGFDYPARFDGKKLKLLAGNKICTYRIQSEREK